MQVFFLTPTFGGDNLGGAASGIIGALTEQGLKVGFFRPIANSTQDSTISTDIPLIDSLDLDGVIENICAGRKFDMLETIVDRIEQLKSSNDLDVLVVEGAEISSKMISAAEVNADIANALNARTILVVSPLNDSSDDLANRVQLAAMNYDGINSDEILGVLLTDLAEVNNLDSVRKEFSFLSEDGCPLVGAIPQNQSKTPTIDSVYLKEQLSKSLPLKVSPTAFRHSLIQRASNAKKRIVLPEGDEPRTVQAAIICHQKGIAKCVLIAKRNSIEAVAEQHGVSLPDDIEIIEPNEAIVEKYVPSMVERRKSRGLTPEDAEKQLQDTVVLGTMMLADGDVDGLVSGAVHTTANTIRPAFQLIKTHPDAGMASSVFFMLLPENVLVYGDCAINPNPNAEQLATIAIQSAKSALAFGIEPKVAMISYSTGASGMGDDVELVKEATEIAQKKRPDLLIEGPLQYDAASVESVANKKAPDSKIGGKANVFIFPDLNTGNTTYKAVQRSAGVISIGPMLQGLNKPVNDLSRGALVDDIVYTIALTAIQAV